MVVDGVVYFGSNDWYLYALDASSGERIWRYDAGVEIVGSAAIYGSTLFFASSDMAFHAVLIESGKSLWKLDEYGGLFTPMIVNDLVFTVFANPKWPAAISTATGENTQPYQLSSFWQDAESNRSSPALYGDNLIIVSGSHILSFNIESGSEVWALETRGLIRSSPGVAGDVVYFGCDDGNLYAVDADTGERIWRFNIEAAIRSSPAVVGGVVYVGAEDGNLYAVVAS